MLIASAGRTELRCSLPVLLLVPAAVVFGRATTLALCLLSLAVHELSHAFMARRLGFPVAALEIQPFGFIARLARQPDTPSEAAAVAAAGPVVSLLLALTSAGLIRFTEGLSGALPEFFRMSRRILAEFSAFNLSIGAVNLLPVLPLDGGRLAFACAESGHSAQKTRRRARLLCVLGVCCGLLIALCGLLLVLSGPSANGISLTVTGIFIAIAALTEARNFSASAVRARLSTVSRLNSGGAVRVLAFAIDAGSTVSDALRALSARGYGVVLVTDASMRTIGILDESALLSAAMRGETDLRLDLLLTQRREGPDLLTK